MLWCQVSKISISHSVTIVNRRLETLRSMWSQLGPETQHLTTSRHLFHSLTADTRCMIKTSSLRTADQLPRCDSIYSVSCRLFFTLSTVYLRHDDVTDLVCIMVAEQCHTLQQDGVYNCQNKVQRNYSWCARLCRDDVSDRD